MTTNDNKTDGNRRSSRLQDSFPKGVESAGDSQDNRVIVKNRKGELRLVRLGRHWFVSDGSLRCRQKKRTN